jgi:hypothetical protein
VSLPGAIEAALALHRSLIDATKIEYELRHGPIPNPYALFALVSQDPFFQWLQPMTRLLVELEELRDRVPPPTAEETAAALRRLRALVDEGSPLHAKLSAARTLHPPAASIHASLLKLLG